MKNLIHTAVVTLFAASAAHAQQAVQWKVSDGGNGHWYQVSLSTPGISWMAADASATTVGGYLASVRSSSEAEFVEALANTISGAYTVNAGNQVGPWLGGARIGGTSGWRWTSAEPWDFTQWCAFEPSGGSSEPYVHLMRNGATVCWNDRENNAFGVGNPSYFVEWSADCNGDGIVDYGQCRDGTLPDYKGNNIPDCCESGTPCVVGNYPVQWRIEDGGNGHWYQLRYTSDPRWETAKIEAQLLGGYLATPTSPAENQRVYLVAQSPAFDGPYFGGFKNDSGECEWVTGERFVFSNWGGGEPNGGLSERFLHFKYGPVWNDAGSPYAPGYLVEWSADCNEDGIVDYGQILTGQLADLDSNGIPDICQQPTCRDADIYRDFNVNGADLGILLSQWGPNSPLTESDINKDGFVNGADLGIMLSFWGACPN
jgi:hypothetical protein